MEFSYLSLAKQKLDIMTTSEFWDNIASTMFKKGVSLKKFENVLPKVHDVSKNVDYELETIHLKKGLELEFISVDGDVFNTPPKISKEEAMVVTDVVYGNTYEMFFDYRKDYIYDNFVDELKTFYEERNLVGWEDIENKIHEKLNDMFCELEATKPTKDII